MRKFFPRSAPKPKVLLNEKIPFASFLVIDQNNRSLGVLSKSVALQTARDLELDLVCVNDHPDKPICKIVDYDNYRFSQQKATKKQKTISPDKEEKEIRISANIGDNDLKVKAAQCQKFLQKKYRVKITMRLRGREKYVPNYGVNKIEQLLQSLCKDNIVCKAPQLKQHFYTAFLEAKK